MTRKALGKCGAKTRAGTPCIQPSGWGTGHVGIGRCRKHGGNTETHRKAAEEEQARAAVITYGRPIITTGVEALLDELYWTTGHCAWLRWRVQELSPDALVWGETRRADDAALGQKVTWEAGVSVWLKLYLEERKHKVDVAERCVRANIDERRVRLAERDGAHLVGGLQWLAGQLTTELRLTDRKVQVLSRLVLEMLKRLDVTQPDQIQGAAS